MPILLLVLAVSCFALSAMVRQYREFTVPLTVLLVALAIFSYVSGKRRHR